jgi:hypothetical protein
VQDAFEPRYVPTGHLVFARGSTLFAAPFNAERVELTGAPIAVIENVLTRLESGGASYRVSDAGILAYTPAVSLQGRKLVWRRPLAVLPQRQAVHGRTGWLAARGQVSALVIESARGV